MLERVARDFKDAAPSRADPTGTGALRGKLRNDLDRRWAKLRRLTTEALNGSLFHPTVTGIAHAAQQIEPVNKVQMFQKWFDEALRQVVLEGNGEWIARYVDAAGEQARTRVSVLVGGRAELDHSDMQHLGSQMEAELQGIVEATSQQSVRAFSNCLLAKTRSSVIARQINSCIRAVGQKRGILLADYAVTKSYAIASLSAMRSLGISKVGTIAERKVKIKQTKHGKTFADARDLPDIVEVLTAGDEDVCLICEDISDSGPYDIDEAVELIPAHPRCRCAFVPADDARYADVRDYDPDQPRDFHGRWTGEAGANGGRTGTVGLGEAQRAATKAAAGAVPLQGLPQAPIKFKDGSYYVPGPIGMLRDAASNYMRSTGLKYDPPQTFQKVDTERATHIAQAFDAMAHDPTDPQVKASYDAMAKETIGQYHALKDMGIAFEFIPHGKDPYAESPRLAAQDVIQNKHLWVFPTSSGFGSGDVASAEAIRNNPLLAPTNEYIGDHRLVVNDVFRIVHDMFGHFKEGNGFRADGEENAWRSHAAMYSDLARGAMTSETRGQNSWVNYGPHGEANRTASAAATVFAPQKIGLLPDWVMREGRFDKNKLHDAIADWFASCLDYNPEHLPAGSPEGGQFAPKGAGGEGGEQKSTVSENPPFKLDKQVIDVGGDAWNRASAVKLETEYQAAKPALEALAQKQIDKGAVEPEPDEEEDTPFVPEEWDQVSASEQDDVKDKWMNYTKNEFLDSEQESWYENSAYDDTMSQFAQDWKNGQTDLDDWFNDAMDKLRDDYTKEGKEIPFDNDQLFRAISLEYEGSGNWKHNPEELEVTFHDARFEDPQNHPAGWAAMVAERERELKTEPTLPGIEPLPKLGHPSEMLTEDMRTDIESTIQEAMSKYAEDHYIDAPDYLADNIAEQQEEYWDQYDDKYKFDWGKDHGFFEEPEQTKIEPGRLPGLPERYDPFGEEGSKNYSRTQILARGMSVDRAVDVAKERGLLGALGASSKNFFRKIDNELWNSWKGSSSSRGGAMLQAATSEELGGRHFNYAENVDIDKAKENANRDYGSNGFDLLKAYVRAKWETTQFVLDKANEQSVVLYRGLRKDYKDEVQQEVQFNTPEYPAPAPGFHYTQLPEIHLNRSGAASFSKNDSIANAWNGSPKIVLRAEVPRTAIVSVPAYGQNIYNEKETVVAGTAWKHWDAWADRAPVHKHAPFKKKDEATANH